MIVLSAIEFDPGGYIALSESAESELGEVTRRVNRVATLDGGVVINDGGHAPGDRTLRIKWRIRSREEYSAVARLLRVHPRIRVTTRDGMFLVSPQKLNEKRGEGDLTLLVIEELI